MVLIFIIAFFPFNVQFQAFDGILWAAFDAGPAHVEVDTGGAIAVWNLWGSGEPAYMNAAYSLVMKED